jgi:hypothetical protein
VIGRGTRVGREILRRWAACGLVAVCLCSQAVACKFVARPPAELLRAADAVFVGKVEDAVDGRSGNIPTGWAVFEVVEARKGTVKRGERLKVLTHNSSCGLSFGAGQVWTIFAAGNPLRADAPSGSFLVEQGAEVQSGR